MGSSIISVKMFASICVTAALFASAAAHGFCTIPRARGAYWTQRPVGNIVDSEAEVGQNGWAYCPHCQNGGGTTRLRGMGSNMVDNKFRPYKPMEGMFRDGVTQCGDQDGNNDHSASGRYRSPSSKPYSHEFKAGGVANFEYDVTTPHGGYLQFFLCDVSGSDGDVQRSTFDSGNCYKLERAYNADCESGNDSECGPIDPNHPSRWYLPCRVSDSRDQDQIVGGSNGKMSFKIPNKNFEKAVIMAYWLTSNNCSPEGLEEYFSSGAWSQVKNSQCAGDGGSIGGYRRDHTGTCETQAGKFPEEFWNCADVKISGGGGGSDNGGSNNLVAEVAPKQNEEPKKEEQQASQPPPPPPQQKQQQQQQQVYQPQEQEQQKQDSNSGSDQFRPGCLPKKENRSDMGYLNYYKDIENYCKK